MAAFGIVRANDEISAMSAVAAIRFDASIIARARVGFDVADNDATVSEKINPAPSPAQARHTKISAIFFVAKDRNWPAAARTIAVNAK